MLDDLERIRSIDREDMLEKIAQISSLVKSGYKSATNLKMEIGKRVRGIHFLGVGGSAMGGDLIRDWLGWHIPGGVHIERGYRLSRPIEDGSLIICCSYSGNTLEVRHMIDEVLRSRSDGVLIISSGGKLSELARDRCLPIIPIEQGLPPRASLPSVISAIAVLSDRIGWTDSASSEVMAAAERTTRVVRTQLAPDVPTEKNFAKQLAHQIYGFVPIAIAPYTLESIIRRWKTQMNENAKQHCFYGCFPEVSHNEIIPWLRDSRSELLISLIMRDIDEHPQMTKDLDRFRDTLASSVKLVEIQSLGESRIEYLLNHILISDFTSVYSAILSGIDPTPVDEIASFKKRD